MSYTRRLSQALISRTVISEQKLEKCQEFLLSLFGKVIELIALDSKATKILEVLF